MTDIKPRKRKMKPNDDFSEFRQWLTTLDMINPVLHINGAAHPIAVLTVDFGTPLVEQKLTPEQNAELVTRMRTATKALCPDKDVPVRIQNDGVNGIWWSATV